jgi:hypothetical protein
VKCQIVGGGTDAGKIDGVLEMGMDMVKEKVKS